jgi:hypothetical protein
MRKNTVAATMEMEIIQKEMATVSLGFKNPCKSKAMMLQGLTEGAKRSSSSVAKA